ncbi:hypothetical protein [Komagataeibacter europaeus]|uniref:hypothetical protein n=1 Tax=Komagataeibacter europaeus TaxID=33995 RepID=UPI00037F7F39|nr:hypothetical protein [Komagataeibacter europaeus]GBQ47339.1 hypothetical protein AA18890_2757 [Komagataeibacter europaeus LMG 18890]
MAIMSWRAILSFLFLASTAGTALALYVGVWNNYTALVACVFGGITIATIETMATQTKTCPSIFGVCTAVAILACAVEVNHMMASPAMKALNLTAAVVAIFAALQFSHRTDQ